MMGKGHDLYDTPGWAPTRLTDLVCPECACRLVAKESALKFLQLRPAVLMLTVCHADLGSGDSCNFSVYPAEHCLHVTNPVKAGDFY